MSMLSLRSQPPASSFLIASYINIALYAIELSAGAYMLTAWKPSGLQRWFISLCLLGDGVNTVIGCADTFLLFVTFGGTLSSTELWTFPTRIVTTYLVTALVQTSFCLRYWNVTKNKVVSFIILALIVLHTTFSWVASIFTAVHPETGANISVIATSVTVVSCAVTDVLVAFSLVYVLKGYDVFFASTKSLIRRICILSISSGLTTSIMIICMLIVLLIQNAIGFVLLFSALGRVYTLTMFINFYILRQSSEDTEPIESNMFDEHELDIGFSRRDSKLTSLGPFHKHTNSGSIRSQQSPSQRESAKKDITITGVQSHTLSVPGTPSSFSIVSSYNCDT